VSELGEGVQYGYIPIYPIGRGTVTRDVVN
jgi:hypothetical protein